MYIKKNFGSTKGILALRKSSIRLLAKKNLKNITFIYSRNTTERKLLKEKLIVICFFSMWLVFKLRPFGLQGNALPTKRKKKH